MMNILGSIVLYLLLVSNAVLVAAGGIAVVRFWRRGLRLEHFRNRPNGAALAGNSSEQQQRQILLNMRLERQLSNLQKMLQTPGMSERSSITLTERQLPIDNAVRMAKNGASADQLIRNCGLNISEARLMRKLHSRSPSSISV